MKSPPEAFDPGDLTPALAEGWGFHVQTADYAPVGAGSYHWVVTDNADRRRFATVDDLDQKPWLGDTRDAVFAGLGRALDTAIALHDGGLDFVVAPMPTERGGAVLRVGSRYSVALFPFVSGEAGRFGRYGTGDREAIVAMLARLHAATAGVAAVAPSIDLNLPGRRALESAVSDLDGMWSAGPFSEPAREALVSRAPEVVRLLSEYDRLAAAVAGAADRWVVTHGEPHAANVMRTAAGHVLIDWDTVAFAPPERDLWMLLDSDVAATVYTATTGHQIDQAAVGFFRLRWQLADIAAYTDVLRSAHEDTEDTADALAYLTSSLPARAALA